MCAPFNILDAVMERLMDHRSMSSLSLLFSLHCFQYREDKSSAKSPLMWGEMDGPFVDKSHFFPLPGNKVQLFFLLLLFFLGWSWRFATSSTFPPVPLVCLDKWVCLVPDGSDWTLVDTQTRTHIHCLVCWRHLLYPMNRCTFLIDSAGELSLLLCYCLLSSSPINLKYALNDSVV